MVKISDVEMQVALDILKAARTPPNFRESYGFEAWRVELGDGEEVVH